MQKFLIPMIVYIYHTRFSSCKSILLGEHRLCNISLSITKVACVNKAFTLLFLFMFKKKVINKLKLASGAITAEVYSFSMAGICHPFFSLFYLSFINVHCGASDIKDM